MDTLSQKLKEWADKYECSEFIGKDPVQFPRRYTSKCDVEISGFISSWISYGNRKAILAKAEELDAVMKHAPYEFIRNGEFESWRFDERSLYRFFKYTDLYGLCRRLQTIYARYDDMEAALLKGRGEHPLVGLQSLFSEVKGVPLQEGNSACKRLCMFLRWMVRQGSPVDLGVWKSFSPDSLLIPLDVHVYQQAVRLNITRRRSADRKTAEEITSFFRNIFPDDPTKGDFALFGEGVSHQ